MSLIKKLQEMSRTDLEGLKTPTLKALLSFIMYLPYDQSEEFLQTYEAIIEILLERKVDLSRFKPKIPSATMRPQTEEEALLVELKKELVERFPSVFPKEAERLEKRKQTFEKKKETLRKRKERLESQLEKLSQRIEKKPKNLEELLKKSEEVKKKLKEIEEQLSAPEPEKKDRSLLH